MEQSQEWIDIVNAPSFVTVLPYTYTTHVKDFTSYAGKSDLELYDELFLKDLPAYATSRRPLPHGLLSQRANRYLGHPWDVRAHMQKRAVHPVGRHPY